MQSVISNDPSVKSVAPPRVSIGLPVYNGELLLRRALDGLLEQDYRDYELIISDNASTDGTATICHEYAAKDRRVRYLRNPENIGAARNFERVLDLAKGEYFAWAAHDDVRAPSWLGRCVQALDERPSAVIAQTQANIIDDQGKVVRLVANLSPPPTTVRERFAASMSDTWWGLVIYGLFRTTALRLGGRIANHIGADKVLMSRLSLLGEVVEVPEPLFGYSQQPPPEEYFERLRRTLQLTDVANKHFPYINLMRAYCQVALEANLPTSERAVLVSEVLRWYVVHAVGIPLMHQFSVTVLGQERYASMREHFRKSGMYRRLWSAITGVNWHRSS